MGEHKRRTERIAPADRAAQEVTRKLIDEGKLIEAGWAGTAMFTLEQCRAAWVALSGVTYAEIREWTKFGDRRRPAKRRAAR